jgi:hypothetical protein
MRWMATGVALCLLAPAACGGNRSAPPAQMSEFVIRLSGTEIVEAPLPTGGTSRVHQPVTFTMTVTTTRADGTTMSETVDGFVPDSYTARGIAVTATAKKTQAGGTLAITLTKGDAQIASQETSAAFGSVSVAGR